MVTCASTDTAIELEPVSSEQESLQEFGQSLGQITHHSAVFFAGTVFTMAASYFVKIYVVHILGAELLGIYALGMTLVAFLQVLGVLGLPGAAARFVAVYNATGNNAHLRAFLLKSSAIVLFLGLTFGSITLFRGGWIAQHLYHSPELAGYMGLFAVLMLLNALTGFYAQVLAGFKDVAKRTVITNFIGTPVVLLLTLMLLGMGLRLRGYLAAQMIASVVVLILLLRAVWDVIPRAVCNVSGRLVNLDADVVPFAAASFAMNGIEFLTTQGDKILIGLYLAVKPVGIYVLASTLAAFIPLVLQSVNQIFAPVIADLHARQRHEVLQRLFQTLTRWVLAATLPLAAVSIVFAPQLMRLFGAEFEAGWPVLVIVAVGQIVNCAVGSVGYLLLMSGNQNRVMKVQLAAAAISVVTNFCLIPTVGIVGAAIAAALVNVFSNLWNLIEVRRALQLLPYNRSYYKLVVPTGLMVGALALLRAGAPSPGREWMVVLLALVVGYSAFGLSVLAFGMAEEDRKIAGDLLRQARGGLQRLGVTA
ncbi:MAG TPA: oligosaccharide flippase family protein [Terriglobales bacterium]|nr:oligosaccharide flippase family protein [Terriglobales bacterium]